ncbi:hypothetical protein QJS04_geneDACA019643 [Acorus gramineus]|uniref:PHD-type zinc finger plants domain-containing protein n=1 Tax=Acorus gramineus TaxID=55184 RepID=A0AAV9BQ11_ACOGR|nr:hypothetical protein QJS04_geneDACA019643 [Acorus gramineus]
MGAKGGRDTAPRKPISENKECCMCGDHGLSHQLFRCNICLFRSQHRYCSNRYPKADSYKVCNWCLRDDGGKKAVTTTTTKGSLSKEGSQSTSPTSPKTPNSNSINNETTSPKFQQRGSIPLSLINKPIKKQKSLDKPPAHKKIVVKGCVESSIQRTRSDEVFNVAGLRPRPKPAFRVKIRRYKLLEEVTS